MGAFARLTQRAVKSLPLPGSGYSLSTWAYALSRGGVDESWRGAAGDGSKTSIVEACINYMARTFPEAPPALWQTNRDGERAIVPNHPIVELLKRPTPYHSGPLLWMATLSSWVIDGNAYWIKVRAGASGGGRVVQLWYVPHWMIAPKSTDSGNTFISHYEYRPRGNAIAVRTEDVIHFRHGINPDDIRLGRSPIADQLREVFTDEEAARFTASLLRNYGIPGLVVSPTGDAELEEDEQETAKGKLQERFGGQKRGEPIVMSRSMKVEQFGFSPAQLDLSGLRDIPEERITAALGLPNAVVGFGSGLQNTTANATLREWREQAWEGCIIPTQRLFAADLGVQLVPEFVPNGAGAELGFDLSSVRVLQEDENKRVERDTKTWLAGGMLRSEYRSRQSLPTTPADDVFAVPLGVSLTPRDELAPVAADVEPAALPAPAALALAAGEPKPDDEQTAKLRATLVDLRSAVSELAREQKSEVETSRIELAEDARKALIESLGRPGLSREDLVVAMTEAIGRSTDALVDAREVDRSVVTSIAARVEAGQKAAAAALIDAVRAIEARPASIVQLPAPRKMRVLYDGDRVIGAEPIEEAV